MSSYGSFITDLMSRFEQLGFFGVDELQTLEAIMTEAANEHIASEHGELIPAVRKADRNLIASDFAAISISAKHEFEVKEGEKVIVYELICEVIGRDFTNGKILVAHPFWGEQWLPEQNAIRIQKMFNMNLLKNVLRDAMSPKFLELFKVRIGQDKNEEIEDKTQSADLTKNDK